MRKARPATALAVRPRISHRPAITLGVGGGGQLAKMTALAATQLGGTVVILERQAEFPSCSIVARPLIGDWDAPASLLELAALMDAVTLETNLWTLACWPSWNSTGTRSGRPPPRCAYAGQVGPKANPCRRRSARAPPCAPWIGWRIWQRSPPSGGFPLLLKVRRNAYDGMSTRRRRPALSALKATDAVPSLLARVLDRKS